MRISATLTKALFGALALTVVTIVGAPPSFAAPSLDVSASEGLSDGQEIKISGSGFEADLSQIAVGQCIENMTGPSDCNLQGGATFRNADGSGSIGSFSIVVKQKFGEYDCAVDSCVIAAAPLPTAVDQATVDANEVVIPITFGSAEEPVSDPAEEEPQPAAGDDELPATGAGDMLPIILIGAGALFVVGTGLRIGFGRSGDSA